MIKTRLVLLVIKTQLLKSSTTEPLQIIGSLKARSKMYFKITETQIRLMSDIRCVEIQYQVVQFTIQTVRLLQILE